MRKRRQPKQQIRVELIDGVPYLLVELCDGRRRVVLKLRSCFGAGEGHGGAA